MASVEELLLAQAAQDHSNQEMANTVLGALGAIGGSALGYDIGQGRHYLGNVDRNEKRKKALNAKAAYDAMSPEVQNMGPAPTNKYTGVNQAIYRLRPGARMAGGLIGLMAGGYLGQQIAQETMGASPAVELLAKAKTGGQLSDFDRQLIEQMIIDQHTATGII